MSSSTGPFSSASYGAAGNFYGEIVNINDPLRRNRVQVRLFGYQDDKGTIPDDKLQWYVVRGSDSQISGAGSTHNYYPGAKVTMGQLGTELMVTGALPGFDSDKRKDSKGNTSTDPDVPRPAQGEKKKQGPATDGQGKDVVQLSRDPKVDKPPTKPDERESYDYTKKKAPFDKGTVAKMTDKMSIGIDKLTKGSDILELIKGMDGNLSGAIKAGIEIAKNLRMNGHGTSKEVIGQAALDSSTDQFQEEFGAAPSLEIVGAIHALLAASRVIANADVNTLKHLIMDGSVLRAVQTLRATSLNVPAALTTRLYETAMGYVSSTLPATNFLPQLQGDYREGVSKAVSAAMDQVNQLTIQAGGPGGLIKLFGSEQFSQFSADLCALAVGIGIPIPVIETVGQGAVKAGLQGPAAAAQAASSSSSGSNAALKVLSKVLNMFQGNQVAMSEIASGQLNPQSLLKIALKYAQKQKNGPQKKFPG